MAGKMKMSDEMVEYVNELFDKGVTLYNRIIKFIGEQRLKHSTFIGEPNHTDRQIEYRLTTYRNKKIKPVVDLGDNEMVRKKLFIPSG